MNEVQEQSECSIFCITNEISFTIISLSFDHKLFLEYWFLLGITILLQIITGIFLGLHYTSDINSAYFSLFFLIREIYYKGFGFRGKAMGSDRLLASSTTELPPRRKLLKKNGTDTLSRISHRDRACEYNPRLGGRGDKKMLGGRSWVLTSPDGNLLF